MRLISLSALLPRWAGGRKSRAADWARRAVRLALWGANEGPARGWGNRRTDERPEAGALTGGSARRLGHSQAGAPGGWGTHRRAAFSSPSWIAGRFECFLRMRHLPKVGE